MSNVLPWHGQSMVPLATLATVQPLWVQIALKALNSPALGWVTTIFSASRTVPPPTWTAATLIATPAGLLVGFGVSLPPPQAASVAAPTTATPAIPAVVMTAQRSMPFAADWFAEGIWSVWLIKTFSTPRTRTPGNNVAQTPEVHLPTRSAEPTNVPACRSHVIDARLPCHAHPQQDPSDEEQQRPARHEGGDGPDVAQRQKCGRDDTEAERRSEPDLHAKSHEEYGGEAHDESAPRDGLAEGNQQRRSQSQCQSRPEAAPGRLTGVLSQPSSPVDQQCGGRRQGVPLNSLNIIVGQADPRGGRQKHPADPTGPTPVGRQAGRDA